MRKFFAICLIINTVSAKAQSFYDPQMVRDLRLTFEAADWDAFLDSVKQSKGDTRLIGNMTLDGQAYPNVGVRYKGNSSYFNVRHSGAAKLPLNIKVNEVEKKRWLFDKYHTIKLSNVFRDPSFIREALGYEIIRKYMPAPEANFVKVTVNNKLLGLYCNTESLDGAFIQNRLKGDKEKTWWVKCDPEWGAKELAYCPKGDKSALMYLGEDSLCYQSFYEIEKGSWQEWIDFIRVLNREPEKIEKYLNVDQTLWMMAYNNVIVNLDSYLGRLSHNFYMYRGADGRFTPVVWDLNLAFGGFGLDGEHPSPLTLEEMQTMSPFLHHENPKRPLFSQLMRKETYRKLYIHHCKTILKDWFYNEEYLRRAKQMMQTIDYHVKTDTNKLYSYDAFQKNLYQSVTVGNLQIVGIKELMQKRTEYFKNHPALNKETPEIETPTIGGMIEEKKSIRVRVRKAQRVLLCVRQDAHSPYRYVPMFDDGKHDDAAAGDGVYGAAVAKGNWQYYVLAENSEAVALLPQRAGYEFLDLKVP